MVSFLSSARVKMDQVFSQSDKVIELIKLSNGHALGFGS